MNYKLIIKPEAELDISNIANWYDSKSQGLGEEFIDELQHKLDLIIHGPLHYQVRYRNVRFVLIERFPCTIHYLFENECIYVLAVFNTAQDPKHWK